MKVKNALEMMGDALQVNLEITYHHNQHRYSVHFDSVSVLKDGRFVFMPESKRSIYEAMIAYWESIRGRLVRIRDIEGEIRHEVIYKMPDNDFFGGA